MLRKVGPTLRLGKVVKKDSLMTIIMASFVWMLLLMWCSIHAAELRGAITNREKEEIKHVVMNEEAPDTLDVTMNSVKQLNVKDVKVDKRQLDDVSSTQSIVVETSTHTNWAHKNYPHDGHMNYRYDDVYYYDDQYDDEYYYDDEPYDDGYYYDDSIVINTANNNEYYYDDEPADGELADGDEYYYDDQNNDIDINDDGIYYDDEPADGEPADGDDQNDDGYYYDDTP